jgi:hypothetical protein
MGDLAPGHPGGGGLHRSGRAEVGQPHRIGRLRLGQLGPGFHSGLDRAGIAVGGALEQLHGRTQGGIGGQGGSVGRVGGRWGGDRRIGRMSCRQGADQGCTRAGGGQHQGQAADPGGAAAQFNGVTGGVHDGLQ